jgi:hypothetical protein
VFICFSGIHKKIKPNKKTQPFGRSSILFCCLARSEIHAAHAAAAHAAWHCWGSCLWLFGDHGFGGD